MLISIDVKCVFWNIANRLAKLNLIFSFKIQNNLLILLLHRKDKIDILKNCFKNVMAFILVKTVEI